MIVQCSRCTCPLDANPSQGTVTCTYCGTSQAVSSLQVLRNETPPGWQPPPFWAPPPAVRDQVGGFPSAPFGAPTGQPYMGQPGFPRPVSGGGMGAGCIVGGVALALVLVGGLAVVGFNVARGIDRNAPPTLGTFTPDPSQPEAEFHRDGVAHGGIDAHRLQNNCRGYVARAPDLVIHTTDLRMLSITTSSTTDLTMAVGGPGNLFFCDDDSGEGTNPLVHIALPAGTYPVWVGTYHDGPAASYSLLVDATTPGASSGTLAPDAPPQLGEIALGAPPQVLEQAHAPAGGPIQASTLSSSCRGWIHAMPTANVRVTMSSTLVMTTQATDDLTLVVQSPSGEVSCDDDSGGGMQPRLTLAAGPGLYHVWIGEYRENARGACTLQVQSAYQDEAPAGIGGVRRSGKH